jgi:hypothetical protein
MFGIDDLLAEGLKILDKYVPDGEKKIEAQLEMQKLVSQVQLAQIDANKTEAGTGRTLGMWRAGLGWALAGSAVYQFIAYPFLIALLLAFNPAFPVEKIPVLDWKQIGGILMGMLGLGG